MKKRIGLFLATLLLPCCVFASILNTAGDLVTSTGRALEQHVKYPFYFGVGGGYGDSDWDELVTDPNAAASEAAPISAKSGGFTYKAFMGYQFTRHFAVEMGYTRYPRSVLGFLVDNGTPDNSYDISGLKTDTSTFILVGKLLVPFAYTQVYVYADAGAVVTHKHDVSVDEVAKFAPNYTLRNEYKLGPSFGFGIMYDVTERIVTEMSFQYSTGFDKADDTPVEDYVPFTYDLLWSIGVRV
ncbi:MAG: outer membrane beta-barrel protein [Gammaproteobacteria bacterium]|nr:outer membrane beta-barrel protein [Gammaproteobacteria bacterium]MCH9743501.1 outer membrane beta-barrel protein [Gammaproteobacteria bacterium]